METKRRRIKQGLEYDNLIPKARGITQLIRRDADVSHSVSFIPKVVRHTLFHTEKLIPKLKGATRYETCQKIWAFVHDHISYDKDAHGKEQIRSGLRLLYNLYQQHSYGYANTTYAQDNKV